MSWVKTPTADMYEHYYVERGAGVVTRVSAEQYEAMKHKPELVLKAVGYSGLVWSLGVQPPPDRFKPKEMCQVCELAWEYVPGLCKPCRDALHQPWVARAELEAEHPPYKRPWWLRVLRWLAKP